MDLFIKDAIEELKKNSKGKDIDEKSKKKIYELFPIPREHKILWADNVVENKVSGMVITDIGVFFKSNPSIIKSSKRNCEKKETISSIYHYFRWEYFNSKDFEIKSTSDGKDIFFNGKRLYIATGTTNFFEIYNDSYKKMIKESTVAAANVFADFEAVIPENFSRGNKKNRSW